MSSGNLETNLDVVLEYLSSTLDTMSADSKWCNSFEKLAFETVRRFTLDLQKFHNVRKKEVSVPQ